MWRTLRHTSATPDAPPQRMTVDMLTMESAKDVAVNDAKGQLSWEPSTNHAGMELSHIRHGNELVSYGVYPVTHERSGTR